MIGFHFRKDEWYSDGVPLLKIAEKVGTPAYVYQLACFRGKLEGSRPGLPFRAPFSGLRHEGQWKPFCPFLISKIRIGCRYGIGGEIYLAQKLVFQLKDYLRRCRQDGW